MVASVWTQVVIGTAVVVGVVLGLVGVLLLFQRAFIPHGPFRIVFAGDPRGDIEVSPAGTLLSTLGNAGVLLPSACGGAGTCGLCKVRVVKGEGRALPPERALLSRADVAAGWRLACQMKVRRDLVLELPRGSSTAQQLQCTVTSVRDVASFIREIVLELPTGQHLEFEAGAFIQVHVPAYGQLAFADFELAGDLRDTWTRLGLMQLIARNDAPTTRAYSLANPPADDDRLVLNVRIAVPPPSQPDAPPGIASSYLYSLAPGDRVSASGPFGEFGINHSEREMVYIGGGAGMAPLRSHLLHLLRDRGSERRISYWYGARSRRELFYHDELRELAARHANFRYHVALSEPLPADDWDGDVGFIHEVVHRRYLAQHEAPEEIEFYLCGPPPMMAAVRTMLAELGVDPEQIRFDDFG